MVFSVKDFEEKDAEAWASNWQPQELWEKTEARHRKHRRRLMIGAILVFCLLSMIPIIMDRFPKWKTRHFTRLLAQELNELKYEASVKKQKYQFIAMEDDRLSYEWRAVSDCRQLEGDTIKRGSLIQKDQEKGLYQWLFPTQAQEKFQISHIQSHFCYDPWNGVADLSEVETIKGYGMIPVNDLSQSRMDRASFLIMQWPSAEFSFD